MVVKNQTAKIIVISASEGKALTDGRTYAHSVVVGTEAEAARWSEVDEPEDYSAQEQSLGRFEHACAEFRRVCARIGEFIGEPNFRGGFDEYALLMESAAFKADPTTGLTLAMMWSGANELCVYEGAKAGLGQPEWWYRCWKMAEEGASSSSAEEA